MSTTPNQPWEPESAPPPEQPGEQATEPPWQSPYQQQAQQQSPYQQAQQPYGRQQPYEPYQAAPPPTQYGQPYGYPAGDVPPGMPPLADWGQRATAFMLDNGAAVVAGWVAGAARSDAVYVVFGLIGFVGVIWAVVQAVRAGRTGQSYGKRVMGIRLARLSDGQPVGGGLGFLRLFLNWLFWVLCLVPGVINLLLPLWDRKHQTWCDKIAKSVVVKTR